MNQQIGRYKIIEEIGSGGFATVYKAQHAILDTEVALKVLKPELAQDPDARRRFIQEAQTASNLEHPHIVRIFDLEEDETYVFIVMAHIAGHNLRQWREEHPDAPWRVLLELLSQIAQALDYAHGKGVLHRDVKPANLLIDQKNKAYLADFGLVQVATSPRLTQVGRVVGTPAYVSPEQAQDLPTIDGRADQYSLAVVVYELLVGRPPFQAEQSTAVALMHIQQPPPKPSELKKDVPVELNEVLLRALSKQPDERYPTCVEFIRALEAALSASELRRYRELVAEAWHLFAQGQYEAMHEQIEAAANLLPHRADTANALQELENARQQATAYEQGVQAWRTAQRQAQNVLDLQPDYPDEHGIFTRLELRPPPRRRWSWAEIGQQMAVGLIVGGTGALFLLYVTFLWITR